MVTWDVGRFAIGVGLGLATVGCGDAASHGAADASAVDAVTAPVDAAIDADVNGPAAFRITALELRDPHVYVSSFGCHDITDEPLMQFSVNGAAQARLTGDADSDGALDESIVTVFRPLAQGATTSPLEVHRPRCTAPLASTACARNPATAPVVMTTANNLAGVTCLSLLPGTIRPYMPPIGSAIAPCYRSDRMTLTLELGGLPVPLRDARIAATYFGDPAQGTNNGLLMGFVTVADARATILPASVPLIGGRSLESILPGGNSACTGFSDQDVDGGVAGWWFYFNFIAQRVPWVDD